jgi:hypothetical protein
MKTIGRIFSVRINLDEMFARLDALDASEESAWLKGFRVGARGGLRRAEWSGPILNGHEFGAQAYRDALAFSSKQSAKGKLRHSHGSATAKPNISQPPAISSNPVIQESKNEGTMRASATPAPDIFDGMDQDETVVLAVSEPQEANWFDWRSQHASVHIARRGEDGDPASWERVWAIYGKDIFDAMYARLNVFGKRIYFDKALAWFEANTKDIA